MKKLTQGELEFRIESHQRWLAGSGGERLELRDCTLEGLGLPQAMLVDSVWSAVTCIDTDLTKVSLDRGRLHAVSFQSCRLDGLSFVDCEISDLNADGAPMPGANFSGVFEGKGMVLCNANLRDGFICKSLLVGCNFDGVDLSNANLMKTEFRNCTFRQANFEGANLTKTDFTDVDLRGANLSNALMDRTSFRRVRIHGLRGTLAPEAIVHAEEVDTTGEGDPRYQNDEKALRALLR